MNFAHRVVLDPVVSYASRLRHVFGWRFLAFLGVSQGALKGALLYIVSAVMLPLYKNVLGVDAVSLQFYMLITMVPWSIKPLLGLASDYVSVNNLHKRPWLLQSLVIGCIGMGLSFLALTHRSALGLSLCFAGVQLQIALYDLMSEAVFSARMRNHDAQEPDETQRTGSDIVTFSQVLQTVGGIGATLFVGVMADRQAFVAMLAVASVLCFTPLLPTLWGWLSEERDQERDPGQRRHCCWGAVQFASAERVREQRNMMLVILFTGLAAPVTAVIVNAGDAAVGMAVASVFCAAAVLGAYACMPRMVAHLALYQVLKNVGSPSVGSALDYFFLADEACVPGGPAFSFRYYYFVAGIVGYGATLAGGLIYQAFFSKMRFRTVVLLTTVLSALTGLSDLFIVTRANIALGIPDKMAYVCGEAIVEPLIGMLAYIPVAALLSKAVVPGMEGSVYAYTAGISNFSSMIRELSGALLFDAAGVTTVVPCNFSALPWLVLVCHAGLPLVIGVAAAWLIPNEYQTADMQVVVQVATQLEPSSDAEFSSLVDD